MQAFQVGSIDAAIFPFGEGAAIVEEALSSGLIELLRLPTETRDAALQRLPPAVAGRAIPAGMFSGQTDDISTFTLNAYLLARASVDPEIVSEIVATVFEHRDEFVQYQGAAREWTLERTLEDAPVPYHEGTIRYLQSAGLWNDTLDSRQQALLVNSTAPSQ
jgi:TRAP transporter TAXI family solute receptor